MDALYLERIAQALLLLLAANAAPILARGLLRGRFAYPLDGGKRMADSRRLLGHGKTWRGLLAAISVATILAGMIKLPLLAGFWFGVLTMMGDLLASFCKRRLGYAESSHAPGLDTVPESLLPLLVLKECLVLSVFDILVVTSLFFLLEEFLSPVLYRWHIRNRPY